MAVRPRGGLGQNKMEKREILPRKFNVERRRDVRRDEVATWRQSHGSGSHKCNVEVRGLQSDHLTVSPDEDVFLGTSRYKTRKLVFRRNTIQLSLETFK